MSPGPSGPESHPKVQRAKAPTTARRLIVSPPQFPYLSWEVVSNPPLAPRSRPCDSSWTEGVDVRVPEDIGTKVSQVEGVVVVPFMIQVRSFRGRGQR